MERNGLPRNFKIHFNHTASFVHSQWSFNVFTVYSRVLARKKCENRSQPIVIDVDGMKNFFFRHSFEFPVVTPVVIVHTLALFYVFAVYCAINHKLTRLVVKRRVTAETVVDLD